MSKFLMPNGRLNRFSFLCYIFLYQIIVISIESVLMIFIPYGTGAYKLIVNTMHLWGIACLTVQRLHDLNRPMKHLLLFLVPFYNLYLLWNILFVKGTEDTNMFGEPFIVNHKS